MCMYGPKTISPIARPGVGSFSKLVPPQIGQRSTVSVRSGSADIVTVNYTTGKFILPGFQTVATWSLQSTCLSLIIQPSYRRRVGVIQRPESCTLKPICLSSSVHTNVRGVGHRERAHIPPAPHGALLYLKRPTKQDRSAAVRVRRQKTQAVPNPLGSRYSHLERVRVYRRHGWPLWGFPGPSPQ